MKSQPRVYTADHPMLRDRSGDPARGAWKPKERDKPRKGKRRR